MVEFVLAILTGFATGVTAAACWQLHRTGEKMKVDWYYLIGDRGSRSLLCLSRYNTASEERVALGRHRRVAEVIL